MGENFRGKTIKDTIEHVLNQAKNSLNKRTENVNKAMDKCAAFIGKSVQEFFINEIASKGFQYFLPKYDDNRALIRYLCFKDAHDAYSALEDTLKTNDCQFTYEDTMDTLKPKVQKVLEDDGLCVEKVEYNGITGEFTCNLLLDETYIDNIKNVMGFGEFELDLQKDTENMFRIKPPSKED